MCKIVQVSETRRPCSLLQRPNQSGWAISFAFTNHDAERYDFGHRFCLMRPVTAFSDPSKRDRSLRLVLANGARHNLAPHAAAIEAQILKAREATRCPVAPVLGAAFPAGFRKKTTNNGVLTKKTHPFLICFFFFWEALWFVDPFACFMLEFVGYV